MQIHEALLVTAGEDAQALVKKAVIEDGCGLMVGPLLTDIAPSVAKAAALMESHAVPRKFQFDHGRRTRDTSGVRSDCPTNRCTRRSCRRRERMEDFVAMIPQNDLGLEAL